MSAPNTFPFLDLPPELRDTVYTFALSLADNRTTDAYDQTRYHINPTWLRINKQIHQEALRIFRKNIFVAITTPWPRAYEHIHHQGYVPLLAIEQEAEKFKAYHMDIQISSPSLPEAAGTPERFIISIEDLKRFCDFWFYQDLGYPGLNTNLNLTLVLQDPHSPSWETRTIPKALQRRLIEPLGVVRNLSSIKIVGECYESIEKEMRDRMVEPVRTAEECVQVATKLKEEGNVLLGKKLYKEAIKKYEESFFAIHILVKGRRRSVFAEAFFHSEILHGPDRGNYAHIVRLMLRFKLVANIVMAFLQLEDYEEARFWGKRTIDLLREQVLEESSDLPASKEIGKIYYRTGKACTELGDYVEAMRFLQTAWKYLPSDRSIINKELARVRELEMPEAERIRREEEMRDNPDMEMDWRMHR